MGETTDQIETHIRSKRDDLQANFQELEHKVKAVADWRRHFQRHPAAFLGFAIAGGMLIGSATRHRDHGVTPPATRAPDSDHPRRGGQIARAWDDIQAALVGAAVSKIRTGLAQVLPGFKEQIRPTEGNSPSATDDTDDRVQGEGNYAAARRYRRRAERFAATADVDRAAREAAPNNALEAQQMAAAEAAGRERQFHAPRPEKRL